MIKQTNITDKIVWIEEALICDDCGSIMQYSNDGAQLMSYPPRYIHNCSNQSCGGKTNALAIYPRYIMDVLK